MTDFRLFYSCWLPGYVTQQQSQLSQAHLSRQLLNPPHRLATLYHRQLLSLLPPRVLLSQSTLPPSRLPHLSHLSRLLRLQPAPPRANLWLPVLPLYKPMPPTKFLGNGVAASKTSPR